jgi:CRP/FNR family transcriptional regulator
LGSDILREIGVFEDLDAEGLETLLGLSEERAVDEDEIVYRVGDPSDSFLVILDGRVVVFRDEVGHPVRLLSRLEGGEWFGEMAVFGEEIRRSSARATEPTRLLAFGRDAFLGFLEAHPRVLLSLQIAAARRKSLDSAAALGSDQHEDSRIALDEPAVLVTVQGRRDVAILNLSLGGISLSGAPAAWERDDLVRLHLEIGEHRFEREARVVWRSPHGLGLAFESRPPGHHHEIYKLLHQLTDG